MGGLSRRFGKSLLAMMIALPMVMTNGVSSSLAGSKHYHSKVIHKNHGYHYHSNRDGRRAAAIAGAIFLGTAIYLHRKNKKRYVARHHHVHKRKSRIVCHYHGSYRHCHRLRRR